MKTTLSKQYESRRPLAVLPLSNFGGLAILDILSECGDSIIIAAWNFGRGYENTRRHTVKETTSGRSFIRKGNRRFYLDQMQRI